MVVLGARRCGEAGPIALLPKASLRLLNDLLQVHLSGAEDVDGLMLLSTYTLDTTLGYVLGSLKVLARWLESALGAPPILDQVALHAQCGILELIDPLLFKFICYLCHRHIPDVHLGQVTHGC
jgi:hypothetical protein